MIPPLLFRFQGTCHKSFCIIFQSKLGYKIYSGSFCNGDFLGGTFLLNGGINENNLSINLFPASGQLRS